MAYVHRGTKDFRLGRMEDEPFELHSYIEPGGRVRRSGTLCEGRYHQRYGTRDVVVERRQGRSRRVDQSGIDRCARDNAAARSALANGGVSKALRPSRRTAQINQSWLCDLYANPANSYRWHSGKRFHPDGQTKPLPRENFEPFRNANLAREADIKKLVAVETDTEETKSAMESDKTKKEVDTEAAGEVASRSKELSKRKQKAIERAKEYLSSAAKGKELSKRDLHLAMHHVVFDDECEECLGGKQRRAPHSHKGASKLRKRWFCVDTGGPVSLKTFRGERYWAGWHEEESQFEMSDPLVSKHSRNMVKSLQNFSLECGFRPNGVSSDGGKEMQGEFNEEIVRIGAQRFMSEPDRSWEAGAAEVRQGTSHALAVTLMEDSNVPEQFWGLGLKHADLARNLILGRWEHLRGEDSWKKAMSRLIPFGNAVSTSWLRRRATRSLSPRRQ